MLQIQNLSKTYSRGKKEALKSVDLNIRQGEFTALLGQNGAGKSTLINILAGNVRKSSGSVLIGGYDLDRQELETKKVIGIVPQEIAFDYVFTVGEVLSKQSGYFGIKNNERYIDELLESLSLLDKKNTNVRDLSGGMKRRLLIAKALIHKPKLLILDEPTAGVDIDLRHSLYDFLNKLHQSGTTIILTTHYLEEAEKLCERIVIIDSGAIIADEPKERLMENFSKEVLVEVHFDTPIRESEIEVLKEYSPRIAENTKLHLKVLKGDLSNMLQKLIQRNMNFVNMVIEKQKLEDIYLKLIRQ